MAVLSYSWHNADETWQSVEVAHGLVFARGHRTWEWTIDAPIRSSLHPLLFAPLFLLLKVTGLDYHWLVSLFPRILQGVISAVGDYFFFEFYRENVSHSKKIGANFALLYCANVYMNFSSSRTLINTLEMNLTNIALYFYARALTNPPAGDTPPRYFDQAMYVAVIAASFTMRMTTVLFWLPLVLYHVVTLFKRGHICQCLLLRMVPTACLVLIATVVIDSCFYGKYVIVPWNFFQLNVLQNVSTQYGHEPWHYYFTSTLLPAMNLALLHLPHGVMTSLRTTRNGGSDVIAKVCALSAFWTLAMLSLLKHKEQRFVLPVLPVLLAMAARGTRALSRKFTTAYLTANVAALAFLVTCHKIGSTNVISHLASEFESKAPNSASCHKTGILLLLPCHHTPLYSHFHHDFPIEFLQCPPALGVASGTDQILAKQRLHEADAFFADPDTWMKRKFGPDLKLNENNFVGQNASVGVEQKDGDNSAAKKRGEFISATKADDISSTNATFSHVVLYDKTSEFPVVQEFFRLNGMRRTNTFFQTPIHAEIEKYGYEITVYCKTKN